MRYSLKDFLKEWEDLETTDPVEQAFKHAFSFISPSMTALKGTELFDLLEHKDKVTKCVSRAVYFYVSGYSAGLLAETAGYDTDNLYNSYEAILNHGMKLLKELPHNYINLGYICKTVLEKELDNINKIYSNLPEQYHYISKQEMQDAIRKRVSDIYFTLHHYDIKTKE